MAGTLKIQMYGNSNLSDSSSITIYNDRSLEGTNWTFNKLADYPEVFAHMRSYIFTGSETSWLLFDDYNFTGASTCLGPSEFVQKTGYGITYSWDERQIIHSIKPAPSCPSEEPEPTTEGDSSGVSRTKLLKDSLFGILMVSVVALLQ